MAPKGKSKSRNEDLKQEDVLQAVVIADSFNVRFGPITNKKPRALLPLVNVPLIDYTLEALAASKVQEVFIFCCHLGEQVREHIKQSKWQDGGSPMVVTTIMSDSCLSLGDALREIDSKSLIRNDFILITGDIISNLDISEVVKEHKARIQGKDKSSVMTLVFKVAQPGHRCRTKESDVFLTEDGGTGRLLFFKRTGGARSVKLPMEIMMEHDDLINHNDLMDCHISICSAVVPTLFTDNFDYLTRDDFIKGILINEEIMGNKIHLNVIRHKYAARVSNMQTYDAVSKDIISRWTYPYVPDLFGSTQSERIMYDRHNVYCSDGVTLSRGCVLVKDVVVGGGTFIGSGTKVSCCVIGRNCKIGQNVSLDNCFLWDNVCIEDNCVLDTTLLCSGVTVLENVTVKKGVIMAWDVTVGPDVTIPQGTQLMCEPQRDEFDSNASFGDDDFKSDQPEDRVTENQTTENPTLFGLESKAFQYKEHVDSDEEEEGPVVDCNWGMLDESEDRHSGHADSDDNSLLSDESDEDQVDAVRAFDSDDEDDEDYVIDSSLGFNPKACMMARDNAFYQEMVDTFFRASSEKIKIDNLILEINSLKHAYTVPIDQVIYCLPTAVFELSATELKMKVSAETALLSAFQKNVHRYSTLLSKYIKNSETQLFAINGLGDFVIRHSELRTKLPQLLNFLYDVDVLSEHTMISWYNSSHFTSGSDEALRHAFLRKLAFPFIKWLQEAEEETESDDDDDEADGEA